MTHNEFINLAIQYAKEAADNGGYPFGAVVVKDGKVVGDSRTRPLDTGAINHAETNAIINAYKNLQTDDLTGCVLYSNCHPCGFCMGAIKWAGIKDIYFAMDEADAKSIGHFDEMFADCVTNINENKIANADSVAFMKNWYDKKDTK